MVSGGGAFEQKGLAFLGPPVWDCIQSMGGVQEDQKDVTNNRGLHCLEHLCSPQ